MGAVIPKKLKLMMSCGQPEPNITPSHPHGDSEKNSKKVSSKSGCRLGGPEQTSWPRLNFRSPPLAPWLLSVITFCKTHMVILTNLGFVKADSQSK